MRIERREDGAFWTWAAGLSVGIPVSVSVADGLELVGVGVLLPGWLLASSASLTLVTVLLSGLFSLRSLRLAQPAELLR